MNRATLYNEAFPKRPPLSYGPDGWVTGTWCIGACYKNPNPLYGAYPHGYLQRVHAMFPDAQRILHAFSGGLIKDVACVKAWPDWFCDGVDASGAEIAEELRHVTNYQMELVDLHGESHGRFPTWQGDVLDYCAIKPGPCSFDLILADPPYTAEDARKYGDTPVNISKTMRALRSVCAKGGNLVWLDQKWPMHRKDEWKTWGHIGLVRSTNHRMRLVSMFEAV